MGYTLHCVPGNHPFDESDEDKQFTVMVDPRYPPEVKQRMLVYGCGKHKGSLTGHCGKWVPHEEHEECPGVPDTGS